MEFSNPGIEYNPGDVLMVCPHNSEDHVNELLTILESIKLSPNTTLYIEETDPDMPVPWYLKRPFTIKQCAQQFWDLNVKIYTSLILNIIISLKILIKLFFF